MPPNRRAEASERSSLAPLKPHNLEPERLAAFAARVKEARRRYPTRAAFCAAVGITRTTLRALESGTQQPTPETVAKLAAVLHTTPAALTGAPLTTADALLRDLTDEDLRVAQLFHHAGLALKQRVLGLLQDRARAHQTGPPAELSPDLQTAVLRWQALAPDWRYLINTLIERAQVIDGAAEDAEVASMLARVRDRALADRSYRELLAQGLALEERKPLPAADTEAPPTKKQLPPARRASTARGA